MGPTLLVEQRTTNPCVPGSIQAHTINFKSLNSNVGVFSFYFMVRKIIIDRLLSKCFTNEFISLK